MYLGAIDGEIKLFTAIYSSNDVSVAFYSTSSSETCVANVFVEPEENWTPTTLDEVQVSNEGSTSCSNAFAYYVKYAPDLANEINNLVANFDLNEDVIKNGDVTVIEKAIATPKQ